MSENEDLTFEQMMLVQKHQLDQGSDKLGEVGNSLDQLSSMLGEGDSELEAMMATLEHEMSALGIPLEGGPKEEVDAEVQAILEPHTVSVEHSSMTVLSGLDVLAFDANTDWATYQRQAKTYAQDKNIDLSGDPFDRLLSDSQRIEIEKRIKDEFTLKPAQCDKYDYMIAATCGLIGGLIDVVFVGAPGEGKLTKMADDAVDGAVEKFASLNGWKGPREGSDPTKSAIGYLEGNYKINYDHRHGADVDGAFKMSTTNHHIKSLGHSPDLAGLFFSVLGQFSDTAYFVDSGKVISVDTETFELRGSTFVGKVFAGFANWLGHLFSDVAGSSGASGRGSGIPIPFFSMLQFCDFGEFGQHRQTFATIAVQVFEKGYDFRHGVAMAIPVLITELLTRIMWVLKQRVYHEKPWKECIPTGSNPELRRMLLVAHGSLCLVDGVDAGLRSGGDIITFLLRTNMIAWARFGSLALKEMTVMYRVGSIDHEAIDAYIDDELERLF
tara:strand:+ start:2305 stop:3795 length:1491 start_codon:yes stop_codon:yes gene_type:complete